MKYGDRVWVSNHNEAQARKHKREAMFIGPHPSGKGAIVVDSAGSSSDWTYVTPVVEPTVVPWTIKTAPVVPYGIRQKGEDVQIAVVTQHAAGVLTSTSSTSFEDLLSRCEWFNPTTGKWEDCGTLEH